MIDYLTSRNRVEKSSCTFVVTWFMTKASLHFSGEVVVFSISGTGAIKYLHKEKEKRELWVLPHIYAKINSRWIIDVTIKYKTIGFIEVNTGETINGLQLGDDSFDTTPKAPFMKKNSWKKNWTSVKLQTSALPIWAADETWTILMATRERQLPSPDLNLTFWRRQQIPGANILAYIRIGTGKGELPYFRRKWNYSHHKKSTTWWMLLQPGKPTTNLPSPLLCRSLHQASGHLATGMEGSNWEPWAY